MSYNPGKIPTTAVYRPHVSTQCVCSAWLANNRTPGAVVLASRKQAQGLRLSQALKIQSPMQMRGPEKKNLRCVTSRTSLSMAPRLPLRPVRHFRAGSLPLLKAKLIRMSGDHSFGSSSSTF